MLKDHEVEVLGGLEYELRAKYPWREDRFARPLDIGGYNGSHHSATLRTLVRRGWVERQRRPGLHSGGRGSYVYRLTEAGQEALAAHNGQLSEAKAVEGA